METPLLYLGREYDNDIFVKHEELYPFSFGGNKARIVKRYFDEIDGGAYDCVMTYGGAGSNLCRVTANMAASRGMKCVLILHDNGPADCFNLRLAGLFGAETVCCPVAQVRNTIEATRASLERRGYTPYFIPGGGQGLPGIQAYTDCWKEIAAYEKRSGTRFDYIFLPSGTGTTQAGLVCGKLLSGEGGRIVGISIARPAEKGRPVVLENVKEYLTAAGAAVPNSEIEAAVAFEDAYTGGGYGQGDYADTVARIMRSYGMPLDSVYTGKAFAGMGAYLSANGIAGKKILFINTGGVPQFFDDLRSGRLPDGAGAS